MILMRTILFIKTEVEIEKEKALEMADAVRTEKEAMLNQHEMIEETIDKANVLFDGLYESVGEMVAGNEANAKGSTEITTDMQNVSDFCQSLDLALQEI